MEQSDKVAWVAEQFHSRLGWPADSPVESTRHLVAMAEECPEEWAHLQACLLAWSRRRTAELYSLQDSEAVGKMNRILGKAQAGMELSGIFQEIATKLNEAEDKHE
jgi:hypothetical protein